MKTDQTGQMLRLIRVFAERTSFCWFCHEVARIKIPQTQRFGLVGMIFAVLTGMLI